MMFALDLPSEMQTPYHKRKQMSIGCRAFYII